MSSSLTSYYGRMKSGVASINPEDMAQLGEDWMITAAAGAGVGLISAAIGGLDKKIAGFNVPVDGLVSLGLGFAGLQMGGDTGKLLKIASIATGGSAAVRTFEKFFKGGFKVKGDFEDLSSSYRLPPPGRFGGHLPPYQHQFVGPAMGFGATAQDRLVEMAQYL